MSETLKRWQLRIILVLAIVVMTLSAYLFQSRADWPVAALVMAAGFCILGLALFRPGHPAGPAWGENVRAAALRFAWLPAILGVVSLLLVAEISGNLLRLRYQDHVTHHTQFALLVIGVVLVVVGFSGGICWRETERSFRRLRNWRSGAGLTALALGLITLLGLALRLWRLETAVHFFVDEINFANPARDLYHADFVPLVAPFSNVAAFPWVYPYWQAWGISLLGHNLAALRIVSVIFGTLTIPAMYFLARTLFDRRAALLAALLLATFPPHIHFSRLGLNNIVDPLLAVLLFAFLARGLQQRRQVDFVLAGVMLGLTQYFYEGGRVLYPVLALVWVELLALTGRARVNGPAARRLALALLVGLVIALPIYYTLIARDLPLLQRFETAGVGGSYYQVLREHNATQPAELHILRPLLIYVRWPEVSQFYGGETPLILLYALPFFLLGLGYALWRLRTPGLSLALLWVLGTSAGNMLLADSAHAARYVVGLPALVLLIVIGLRYVVVPWRPALAAVGIALAVLQTTYYFGPHLEVYNRQLRPFPDAQDAIFRAHKLPPDTRVCLISDQLFNHALLQGIQRYLLSEVELCFLNPDEITPGMLDALAQAPGLALFVEPYDVTTQETLREHLALHGPFRSPYPSVPEDRQFWLYHTAMP
jgi:hypothetical protein